MKWDGFTFATPPTEEEIQAFFERNFTSAIIVGWDDLAQAMAEESGLPWKSHLDEAWDMLPELRAFAAIWDLCAASQKQPGVELD